MPGKRFLALIALMAVWTWACSKDRKAVDETVRAPLVGNVEIAVVRNETMDDGFASAGTVTAKKSAVLSSRTTGVIVAVNAREGDRVKRGQTLVEIDGRDVRAELQGAQAGLAEAHSAIAAAAAALTSARGQNELAAATFKRYDGLIAKGSVTAQEFDEVSAKYKVAQAEFERNQEMLNAAKARKTQMEARVAYVESLLGYTMIAAPFDGAVTAKTAEVGAMASLGVPLMTIEQSDGYRLEVQVGASSIAAVTPGLAVAVTIDAIKAELTGKVSEIVPAADPQSRTFTIKIDLPPLATLRSGLYGNARLIRGKKTVLLIPSVALIERGQLTGVYGVNDQGRVELRLVTAGKTYDGKIEILSGLSAGDRIVVRGMEKLAEGSRVAVVAAP